MTTKVYYTRCSEITDIFEINYAECENYSSEKMAGVMNCLTGSFAKKDYRYKIIFVFSDKRCRKEQERYGRLT